MQNSGMLIEQGPTGAIESGDIHKNIDDDGHPKRTGTFMSASAHIITAVIGCGVLSLAWGIAQLGWAIGPIVLLAFAVITYFMSSLLIDCYRSPGPINGRRNYTYMDVVRAHLGDKKVKVCGIAQYSNLVAVSIGYTITAAISMVALKKSVCYHKNGRDADCSGAAYPFMIIFAALQILLSQIPNFHKLKWLSILAAAMSFAYSSIGLGLSIAKLAGHPPQSRTTITGVTVGIDVTAVQKMWRIFQAIGNIGVSFSFSTVLVEIQDTLRSPPPENKTMKRATLVALTVTTIFYASCGCIGYAAFGNDAPGNFITGFRIYEPFWLIDFANIAIVVHLVGAYQVFAQPIFGFIEGQFQTRLPGNKFVNAEHALNIPLYGTYYINLFRLVTRSIYVILTSLIAMIFPFFNDFLGLIGAGSFFPLTVYFPIEMHIAQAQIPKYSPKWIGLKVLSWACLVVSLIAAAGSIRGLIVHLKAYKPFNVQV